jgi:hypothetical protein
VTIPLSKAFQLSKYMENYPPKIDVEKDLSMRLVDLTYIVVIMNNYV